MNGPQNHPTGKIGFSPMLITLFAPVAFMSREWLGMLLVAVGIMLLLVVLLFGKHVKDVEATKAEKRQRESLGL